MKLNMKINPSPSCGMLNFAEKKFRWLSSLRQSMTFLGRYGIKVNDLKLAVLVIASLFILGQAFLTLAENNQNPGNLFLDTDQDGLSDQEEKSYGTDPNNADTDRDGYTDGAEVKSGYDPLKPSPGDKLSTIEKTPAIQPQPSIGTKKNLTNMLAEQISSMNINSDGSDVSQEITVDNIKTFAQNFLSNQESSNQTTFSVSPDDFKIKKQDYSKLSKEEAALKKNADAADYIASIFYVLSLNSENTLITSNDFDISSAQLMQEISDAADQQNIAYFDNLEQKTQKVMSEMKNIEVPEEFLETHIKMLSVIKYGLSLKNLVIQYPDDPALNLINLSKIQGFWDIFFEAFSETQSKLNQYALDQDYIKTKLEKLGIDTSKSASSSQANSLDIQNLETSLLNSNLDNDQ